MNFTRPFLIICFAILTISGCDSGSGTEGSVSGDCSDEAGIPVSCDTADESDTTDFSDAADSSDASDTLDPNVDPDANMSTPVFLLAGQSNMEGNVPVDLFEDLMQELSSEANDTLQQRLEDRLTDWYQNYNDGYAMYGYSPAMVTLQASELVRLKGEGTVSPGLLTAYDAVWCGRNDDPVAPLQANCGNPFGPELTLGHYLGTTSHTPTSLIKVVKGGSTLLIDWLSPSSAETGDGVVGSWYTALQSRIGSLDSGPASVNPACVEASCRWGAFIWFQGENDSFDEPNAVAYEQNLTNLIADVRSEVGAPELPVIIVEIGAWAESMAYGADVLAAQRAVASDDSYAEVVVTNDLSGFYHYDPAAQLIIGERIARVLVSMLD